MPAEEWRPIKGFEDEYEVSSKGRVRSLGKKVSSRNKYGEYEAWRPGKLLSLQKDKYGYDTVHLYKNNKHKLLKVHRLVAMAFLETVKGKDCVHHKDGIKDNNLPENLMWCTAEENAPFAKEDGLYQSKHEHYANKIDKWDCLFIDLFSKQYPLKEVADVFNVSISTVSLFRNNKHWSQEETNYAI